MCSGEHETQLVTAAGGGIMEALSRVGINFVIVYPYPASYEKLGPHQEIVHVQGQLFDWLLRKILGRATDLKTILVPTVEYTNLTNEQKELCASRGVRLVSGYTNPDLLVTEVRRTEAERHFFDGLDSEQKNRFQDLLKLGFEAAHMVVRYFFHPNQDYVLQKDVANEYGVTPTCLMTRVRAVMGYLEPVLEIDEEAKRLVAAMRAGVAYFAHYLASPGTRQVFAKKLGLKTLPSDLPLARLGVYEELLRVWQEEKWKDLALCHSSALSVLIVRFGFDSGFPCYRTLEEVKSVLGASSLGEVRQLEESALEFLGINPEAPPAVTKVMVTDIFRLTIPEAASILAAVNAEGVLPAVSGFKASIPAKLFTALENYGYMSEAGYNHDVWERTFFEIQSEKRWIKEGNRVFELLPEGQGEVELGSWLYFLKEDTERYQKTTK